MTSRDRPKATIPSATDSTGSWSVFDQACTLQIIKIDLGTEELVSEQVLSGIHNTQSLMNEEKPGEERLSLSQQHPLVCLIHEDKHKSKRGGGGAINGHIPMVY